VPGWVYLLGYLAVVPLFVYFPTDFFLNWLSRRWPARGSG
jgi:hypothetical protein